MVYITGDCHADWRKFSIDAFPEQREMARDDFVIVCGDFGIWHDDKGERWWFDKWFNEKNFTLLFVDGNHENFDRLCSDEFEAVDFHGGKAHKIRENIYHLMRGHVFELCGKKFFAFGGARSHDIRDGILEPEASPDGGHNVTKALISEYNEKLNRGKFVRINHLSWWEQELPSKEEMEFGLQTLKANGNKVDFIVSHCCPQTIAAEFYRGAYKADALTSYFDKIYDSVNFSKWFFGHFHDNQQVRDKFIMLYEQIVRAV